MSKNPETLAHVLSKRYSDAPDMLGPQTLDPDALETLHRSADRGSCRTFRNEPVPFDLMKTLCAVALASPTKSDLQQRDIILLQCPQQRSALSALVGGQKWVAEAPMLAVFCGNNHRQRALHDWAGIPFANDHLDAFFNASVDAAIALGAFLSAAEATGLGCCPISAVRNEAKAVSDLLSLPDHVFPVAGLAIGYPMQKPEVSMRLPLSQTVHVDRFDDRNVRQDIAAYDTARAAVQPYANKRLSERFGTSDSYCWSTDKVRQYSVPERETFGTFVRAKGFTLD